MAERATQTVAKAFAHRARNLMASHAARGGLSHPRSLELTPRQVLGRPHRALGRAYLTFGLLG
jgi:hypothetical protein